MNRGGRAVEHEVLRYLGMRQISSFIFDLTPCSNRLSVDSSAVHDIYASTAGCRTLVIVLSSMHQDPALSSALRRGSLPMKLIRKNLSRLRCTFPQSNRNSTTPAIHLTWDDGHPRHLVPDTCIPDSIAMGAYLPRFTQVWGKPACRLSSCQLPQHLALARCIVSLHRNSCATGHL